MAEKKWNWLGDHLAVDLANTVRRRGRDMRELLETPADLAEWLDLERGRVPLPDPLDEELFRDFIALRDDCLALLAAACAGKALPRGPAERINAIAVALPLPRVLGADAGQAEILPARFGEPRKDLLATLAAAIVDLLGVDHLHQLAFCDAPSCGQFFHRRRPNQSWCCPACGDRARAARYHRRGRSAK